MIVCVNTTLGAIKSKRTRFFISVWPCVRYNFIKWGAFSLLPGLSAYYQATLTKAENLRLKMILV